MRSEVEIEDKDFKRLENVKSMEEAEQLIQEFSNTYWWAIIKSRGVIKRAKETLSMEEFTKQCSEYKNPIQKVYIDILNNLLEEVI